MGLFDDNILRLLFTSLHIPADHTKKALSCTYPTHHELESANIIILLLLYLLLELLN